MGDSFQKILHIFLKTTMSIFEFFDANGINLYLILFKIDFIDRFSHIFSKKI